MADLADVAANRWWLKVLLHDKHALTDTLGALVIVALIATCIGKSALSVLALQESYVYGEGLKSSCPGGDNMIIETGQEQVAERNVVVSQEVYVIIAIFIAAFILTYVELNRWFIRLNLPAFLDFLSSLAGSDSATKWYLAFIAGAVICIILPMVLFALFVASNVNAMNAAQSRKSYTLYNPLKVDYGQVPVVILLLVIAQALLGKADARLVTLAGFLVTLMVFEYLYFPSLIQLQTAIDEYKKNTEAVNTEILDIPDQRNVATYIFDSYFKFHNSVMGMIDGKVTTDMTRSTSAYKYVLANSKVKLATDVAAKFDPRAMRFSTSDGVVAWSFITTDKIGPLLTVTALNTKLFIFFAMIACLFPMFHGFYSGNPKLVSGVMLVLTIVVFMASFGVKTYLDMIDKTPPVSPLYPNIQVDRTSASSSNDSQPDTSPHTDNPGNAVDTAVTPAIVVASDDPVTNIRHTWAAMKADNSIKEATDNFHTTMQIFVIPVVLLVGVGFHKSYTTAQYMTITATIAITAATIMMASSYAAYSNSFV